MIFFQIGPLLPYVHIPHFHQAEYLANGWYGQMTHQLVKLT